MGKSRCDFRSATERPSRLATMCQRGAGRVDTETVITDRRRWWPKLLRDRCSQITASSKTGAKVGLPPDGFREQPPVASSAPSWARYKTVGDTQRARTARSSVTKRSTRSDPGDVSARQSRPRSRCPLRRRRLSLPWMHVQLEVGGRSTLAPGHMDTWDGQERGLAPVGGLRSDVRGSTRDALPRASSHPVALTNK